MSAASIHEISTLTSNSYKHYFETNAGQYANVKKLFAAISDGDQAYSVLFNCDFGGDCTSKS